TKRAASFGFAPRCRTRRTPPLRSIPSVMRSSSPMAKLGAFHLIRSVNAGLAPRAIPRRASTMASAAGSSAPRYFSTASGIGVRPAAFERRLIGRAGMDSLQPGGDMGTSPRRIGTDDGGFEREAHHHVRRGETVAGEPVAPGQFGF